MNPVVKKILPHLIALIVFGIVASIFFSPIFFDGKKIKQSDIANYQGMSKEISDFRATTGKEALWTNSMFGGMPAYQISVAYKGNLIGYIDQILVYSLPEPANYLLLYLIGFYFLLLVLKIDFRIAIGASIAFALSSYFLIILEVGHNSKAHAIGYMAPVIAGILLTFRGKYLLGGIITAIMISLELNANHLQITYYLVLLIFVLVLMELVSAFREKRLTGFFKSCIVLAVGALLALVPNIGNLWATQEYGKYSTRGPSELTSDKQNQTTGLDRDYITSWSYGKGETMTLLIPNYKGGASEAIGNLDKDALKGVDANFRENIANFSAYFGDQPFTQGPTYVGAIICLLFVIGLFIVKGPLKWWLLAGTILSILLAWGKHFMGFTDFFLDYVPGYDKFRSVSMILVIAEFTMPLLAALALNELIKDKGNSGIEANKVTKEGKTIAPITKLPQLPDYSKTLNYIMGALLAISLLIAISPGIFTDRFYSDEEYNRVVEQTRGQQIPKETLNSFFDNVEIARKAIVEADAWRTFIFLLLASGLIFAYTKYKFRKEFLIYGILMLCAIDLISEDTRYINKKDFVSKNAYSNPFPMSPADEFIKQDHSPSYRVVNVAVNTFNDASTSFYHQSIGGYHGAKLKRYKELIDSTLTEEVGDIQSGIGKGDSVLQKRLSRESSLNMLNTKYIIYNPEAPPVINKNALGNAWFVNEYKIVPDANAEIESLQDFNPKATAIVDQRFKTDLSGFKHAADSAAYIKLVSYEPNDLVYDFKSGVDELTVFSEIYYDKGWNVYIDGKLSPYFRANYVLRAMVIPAGTHKIEWKFEPAVYSTGNKISLAGSILLLALAAGIGFVEWKKSKQV